jgi:hypothetical protein
MKDHKKSRSRAWRSAALSLAVSLSALGQAAAQSTAEEALLRTRAEEGVRLINIERQLLATRERRVEELRAAVGRLPPIQNPAPLLESETLRRDRMELAQAGQSMATATSQADLAEAAAAALQRLVKNEGLLTGIQLTPARALRFGAASTRLVSLPRDSGTRTIAEFNRGAPVMVLMAERGTAWLLVFASGQLGYVRANSLLESAP